MGRKKHVTGIILAGGANTRMKKQNKAFIELEGKPLIEWQLDRLVKVFEEILIVSNSPELFDYKYVRITRDKIIRPKKNTLAGIHAGLDEINNEYGFFVACDMPFINILLIEEMIKFCNSYDVIVPRFRKHVEPTFAIYHKNCIHHIEDRLLNDDYKVTKFFSEVKIKYLDEEFSRKYDPGLYSFFNINTPEDLETARKIIDKEEDKPNNNN